MLIAKNARPTSTSTANAKPHGQIHNGHKALQTLSNNQTHEKQRRNTVGMHDLWARVAGKFPTTSCSTHFAEKKQKTRNKTS